MSRINHAASTSSPSYKQQTLTSSDPLCLMLKSSQSRCLNPRLPDVLDQRLRLDIQINPRNEFTIRSEIDVQIRHGSNVSSSCFVIKPIGPYKLPTTLSTIVLDTASIPTDVAMGTCVWTVIILLPASLELASCDFLHMASSGRTQSGVRCVVLCTHDPLSFKDLPPIKLSYKPLHSVCDGAASKEATTVQWTLNDLVL